MTDRNVRVCRNFKEAEEADREFYRNLTPTERLKIWFELCRFDRLDEPKQRLQIIYRMTPLARATDFAEADRVIHTNHQKVPYFCLFQGAQASRL